MLLRNYCILFPTDSNVKTAVAMEGSFVSHPSLSVEFDEEMFPLEAQLSDLGPAEGIDLCVSLILV